MAIECIAWAEPALDWYPVGSEVRLRALFIGAETRQPITGLTGVAFKVDPPYQTQLTPTPNNDATGSYWVDQILSLQGDWRVGISASSGAAMLRLRVQDPSI